ncbi:hypothetical protein [Acinetobacter brisouii]|uniref:hypothetical protein n=1 Tax=Acinetobacter brisouii TaxID=396323 RepID=UPI001250B084|nr:hypothetical protein [Acinetobacter brisouii]
MTNTTVSLTLNLNGKQAQSVLEQLGQSQKGTANELLRTNRMLEGVLRQQSQQTRIQSQQLQQLGRLYQQNARSVTQQTTQTNASLRTNQLLERVLEQQVRQSRSLSQQTRNQNRDYQLQINMLRQQVAAADRLRQQLEAAGRANREIGRGGTGGSNLIGTTAAIAGGAYAAGMIGSNYLKDPRDYMRQISLSTDTALAGQEMSVPDFNKKVIEMEGFVRNSTTKGGSSPQQMVQALNTLTSSNVYDFKELKDVMLQVSRTGFASGADPNDVALMTVAQRNFGLTNLSRANDQAMRAGQLGSFELRDMARYMPDLLTQGKGAGYIGDKGYRDLLVMMQLSKKTAGTAEGAAVNLSDLLGSFSQYHLGLSFAKNIRVQDGDPIAAYGVSKKRKGFDWTTYVANMREQGIGEVEAAALLLNRQMKTNPLYRKYRDKAQVALKSGNDAEYLENVQAATQIVAQSEVGKIFHNKQALLSFMGFTMNMDKGGFKDQLDKGVDNSGGTIQTSHDRQAAQEYGKDGAFDTARFNARVDNYNGVADWLGNLKQKLADFASSNAGIAAAASAAVLGLTAVATAGGAAALAMRAGGLGGGLGGRAAGAAAGGLASGGAATTAGQFILAGGVGYGIGTVTRDMYMKTETGQKFDDKVGETIAKTLAFFGNEDAKAAVEAQTKYEQMIAEQQRQTTVLSAKFDSVVSAIQNNKPVFNMPAGSGGSSSPLLNSLSQHANTEEKRHGAVPSYLAAK